MAFVSVPQAATLVRRDKKSLYRDIATGKISAVKNAQGRTQIDTAELLRVFGPLQSATDATPATVAIPLNATPDATYELSRLRTENEALRAQIAMQAANLDDLRHALKLIEHKQPARRRWWPF